MRRFVGVKSWIRWPGQPSVRCGSSWTSRKFDFAPPATKPSDDKSGPQTAFKAAAAPIASLEDARRVLKEKFGHDAFRAEQETVVSQILAGRNVLIQWPHYSGRSTAYLAAALAETEGPSRHGLIVVASRSAPFLMRSAEALSSRGISASHVVGPGSDLTSHDLRMKVSAALRGGMLRVLYLHTHLLQDHTVISAIDEAHGGLHMLVIDEANTAPSDEYDVGDGFLKGLNNFLAKVHPRRLIIVEGQDMSEVDPRRHIDTCSVFSSRMPWLPQMNLQLQVLRHASDLSFATIKKILKENPVSTLIYTPKGKRQNDLAERLRHFDFNAHALIGDETAREMLHAFSESKIPIVIASSSTSALVDRPGMCKVQPEQISPFVLELSLMISSTDLRQIIFHMTPGTIEKFDLLCRVAGRDGEPSNCVFVFQPKRDLLESNRHQANRPSFASVKTVVHEIFHRSVTKHPAGTLSLIHDGRQLLELDFTRMYLSFTYSFLESNLGYIKLLGRKYAACRFEVVPGHESVLMNDKTPVGLAILKHSFQIRETGLFELDIIRAAHREGLPGFVQLTAKMDSLHSNGHVKVYPRKTLLTFRLDRVPEPGAETEAIAKLVHEHLLKKHEAKSQKKRLLRNILLGDSCILAAIAKHFGSQLPDGKVRCGRCSVCLDGRPAKTRTFTPKNVDLNDVKPILSEIPERDNPRFLARVATGVQSPRVGHKGLHQRPVFGSMANCKFEDVLEVFANACGVPVEEA